VNWFQRHLNWTWVFAYLIWLPLNWSDSIIPWILGDILLLVVSGWVIKQKGRSLWWLLLLWVFSPLWLKNKKSYRELTETEHFKSTQRKWGIAGVVVFVIGVIILIVALVAPPTTTPLPETPSSPSYGIPLMVIRMNPQYWNTNHEDEALRIFGDKTYYEALDALMQALKDEAWIGDELVELDDTLRSVNKGYHKTHTYIEGEFDCNDMAVELWDILHEQGIVSLIVVGNLDLENESFAECNHAWLVVPYLLTPNFFVIEPTNGEVYSDEQGTQYREGYYYTSPSHLMADIWERW